ncbi:hypothetical protein L211DRAFT_841934 [Terfezia boudieri ATCC MYA-4762]|uniref:Pre-mRNA-splicing factor CWC24 n=1 Tax=Terfezia boudieri ATCC MYA-4762 TaxID=1051890 RepID=A0A3N4LFN6_9PEZI|nr:hypothetical protein L211DRAFT_841934 [Terfezia boudieri ATCC MYA-4762]
MSPLPTDTPTSDSTPHAAPAVPFFRRNNKSKSSIRKRPATPPPAPASDDSDSDSDSNDDRAHRRVKRQKQSGISDASTVITGRGGRGADDEIVPSGFSVKSKAIISTNDATASTSYHNENESEYLARKNQKSPSPAAAADLSNTGTYKGASSYSSFIKRSEDAPKKPTGPLKAPTNIRTITVTDFAPDVCKDYKQTGFCGFGDSCKFLHAREDYAQGWQLDRDWEIKKKNPNAKTHYKTLDNAANPLRPKQGQIEGDGDEVDKELEKIPFACVICKKEYKNPIVTKCGHYFCEACAIQRYRKKNPSCAICGGRTDGVFNTAKGLQKKLDEKKRRIEVKEKEEAERKRLEEEAGPLIQGGW